MEPMTQGARVDVALADDEYWRSGTALDAFRVQLDDGRVVDEKTIQGWMPEKR